jgi:hypothetical protein
MLNIMKGAIMLKTMAKVFGYVLLLVGVLGFIPGATNDGLLLGIFEVNTLHNIIHLVTGAVALYAAMQADDKAARTYFQVFGIVYALVAILGFVYGDNAILGLVASNMADTWLHVVIAVVALYMGFAARD